MISKYIERHTQLEAIDGNAVATIAFDYEHTLVIGDLHTVQHDFEDVINTMQHMHHGDWCLEAIFCTGSAARIRELVYHLRDFDAVGRVNVSGTVGLSEGCADESGTHIHQRIHRSMRATAVSSLRGRGRRCGFESFLEEHELLVGVVVELCLPVENVREQPLQESTSTIVWEIHPDGV